MLVLTRRTGESLKIGDDITITILGCQGNQIKIGIDAPRDVEVHREEVYRRVNQNDVNVASFATAKRRKKKVFHNEKVNQAAYDERFYTTTND